MTNVRELCGEVAFILIEGAPACAAKVGADDICQFDVLKGWWTDAGTFVSLRRANELIGD